MEQERIYSLNIEDVQTVASEILDRHLSTNEIAQIEDAVAERIDWFEAIAAAINRTVLTGPTYIFLGPWHFKRRASSPMIVYVVYQFSSKVLLSLVSLPYPEIGELSATYGTGKNRLR